MVLFCSFSCLTDFLLCLHAVGLCLHAVGLGGIYIMLHSTPALFASLCLNCTVLSALFASVERTVFRAKVVVVVVALRRLEHTAFSV